MSHETRSWVRICACTSVLLRRCQLRHQLGMFRAQFLPGQSPAFSEPWHRRHSGGAPCGHDGRSEVEHLTVDLHLAAVEEFTSALPAS